MRAPRPVHRLLVAASAAVAALGLVAGAAAPAGAGDRPLRADTQVAAARVVAGAIGQLARSKTVAIDGSLDGANGRLGLDLVLTNGHGGGGRLSQAGVLDFVVAPPSVFVRGDATYWTASGADQSTASNLAGKWLKTKSTDPRFANLVQLADVIYWAKQIDLQSAPISKGAATTYHGKKVIPIHDATPGNESTLYVAANGKPYPVAVVLDADRTHGVAFTRYGTARRPPAPSGAVDLPSQ